MNIRLNRKKEIDSLFRKVGSWYGICLLFLLYVSSLSAQSPSYTKYQPDYPQFAFYMPEQAGQLSFGIIVGDKSIWVKEAEIKKSTLPGGVEGTFIYEISDPILDKGKLTFTVSRLADSEGIILSVEGSLLPPATFLLWSYGGASGNYHPKGKEPGIIPEDGIYNVFSVEESAFTLYYGESMKLKVIQGVMPVTSNIRLADERQKESPLVYYQSGKKTETTSLAGLLPLREGEKEYFCIYRQNEVADYNRFMLPALFQQMTGNR